MEYAVDFLSHSERPFFEESVGSRPPSPYGAFVALRDAYRGQQPAWSPAGFGFIEQSGAAGGRVVIADHQQLASTALKAEATEKVSAQFVASAWTG